MSYTQSTKTKNSQKTTDFRLKYKTEKCRYWFEKGYCPFNNLCAFAHDQNEIRNKKAINVNYKTKLCHNFTNSGFCTYGERCQFSHQIKKDIQNLQPATRSSSQESEKNNKAIMSSKYAKNRESQITNSQKLIILGEYGMDFLFILNLQHNSSILKKIMENTSDPNSMNPQTQSSWDNEQTLKKKRLYSL